MEIRTSVRVLVGFSFLKLSCSKMFFCLLGKFFQSLNEATRLSPGVASILSA